MPLIKPENWSDKLVRDPKNPMVSDMERFAKTETGRLLGLALVLHLLSKRKGKQEIDDEDDYDGL